ncbi:MAG: hypothetical protein ACQESD_04060 [Thermoplasmatota archaeon]
MFDKEKNRLKNLLSDLPLIPFIITSELILFIFVFISYFLADEVITITFLVFLSSVLIVSLGLLFLTDYMLDIVGLATIIFVLFGVSMTSLQVESIMASGEIHFVNLSFLFTSVILVVVGLYLFKTKVGSISKKSVYFFMWMYSFLLLIYIPLSDLYLIKPGFGHGELSILGIGLPLSIISAFLNIGYIKEEKLVKDALRRGNLRRLFGDITGAKEHYLKDLDQLTNKEALLTLLADMSLQEGDFIEAIRYYLRCLDFAGARNYHRASVAYLRIRSFSEAYEYQKTALSKNDSTENWLWLGKIAGERNDVERQKECFEKALERDEGYWLTYHEMARGAEDEEERQDYLHKALSCGRYTPFKRKLLKDIQGVGRFAPIFLHPAELEFWDEKEGDEERFDMKYLDTMADAFVSSLDIKDTQILEQFYRMTEAIHDGEELNRVSFEKPRSRFLFYILRATSGETDVISELEKLVGTASEQEACYALSILYGLSGEYSKSFYYLDKIRSGTLIAKTLSVKGVLHYLEGDYGRAMGSLNTAAALGYQGNDIWDAMAKIAEDMSEEEQSFYYLSRKNFLPLHLRCTDKTTIIADVIECAHVRGYDNALKSIFKIDKDDSFPLEKTVLMMFNGQVEQAIDRLNSQLKNDPQQPDLLFCRGVAKMYQRDHEEALIDIDKAIEIGREDPLYVFYRGLIKYRGKEYDEALRSFRYVSKKRPGWDKNRYYLAVTKGSVNT